MKPTRLAPVFVLAAGAIAVVGIALTFGAAPLEVAKIAITPQLPLKTTPLGFVVPAAQAAPIASGAGYFPAQFAAPTQAEEPLPPQF
ncbi:MAG TPA: hypothetical protein VLV56_02535 [Burkholderiales bacterium]|nr:hypothetical protein [Burkholderiales bacterium]